MRSLIILLLSFIFTGGNAQVLWPDTTFLAGTGPQAAPWNVLQLSSGKLLMLGGTSYNGIPTNNLIRLNQDGSLDTSFQPVWANYQGLFVEQADGKLVVAGILNVNGNLTNAVWRLHEDGSRDTTFLATFSQNIYALAIQADQKILVGGIFAQVNGSTNNMSLVRLNTDGSTDTTFSSGISGSLTQRAVYTIKVLPDQRILIGGGFVAYQGITRKGFARLHPNGDLDTTLAGPNISNNNGVIKVNDMVLSPSGFIVMAGQFSHWGSLLVNNMIKFDTLGNVDQAYSAYNGPSGIVSDMELLPDETILICGTIGQMNGTPVGGIALVAVTGGMQPGSYLCLEFDDYARGLTQQADGKVVVVGQFTTFKGQSHSRIIRLQSENAASTAPTIAGTTTNLCAYIPVTVSIASGQLLSGSSWQWYRGTCGGTPIGNGTSATFYFDQDSVWIFVRGENDCLAPSPCDSILFWFDASLDSLAPVPLQSTLPNLSILCGDTIPIPAALDDCMGIVHGTTDFSLLSAPGQHTLIWTFQDLVGNFSTSQQDIQVDDIEVSFAPRQYFYEVCLNEVEPGWTYEWMTCFPDYPDSLVPNAQGYFDGQCFTSAHWWTYVVVVASNGGCKDTTECALLYWFSLDEWTKNEIVAYPNPTTGKTQLELNSAAVLRLYDPYGRLLLEENRDSGTQWIDLSTFASGLYIVELNSDNYRGRSRIIKQ